MHREVEHKAPLSELTPDGLAKSWFGMAILAVAGFMALVLILLFSLQGP